MRVELFNSETNYKDVSLMWEKQNWPVIPIQALPKTGMVVYKDDTPVAAGFLYNTDSSLAWLEFIVANPDFDHEVRSEALDLVVNGLVKVAKNYGKSDIFTVSNHKRLINRYKSFDFKEKDTVTELVRSL